MKRIALVLALTLCFMVGCSQPSTEEKPHAAETTMAPQKEEPAETPEAPETPEVAGKPTELESDEVDVVLYLPNDNVDGWAPVTVKMELSADNILAELVTREVQPAGAKLLAFTQDGETLTVDISKEFGEAVSSTGTTGETIYMNSLANSLLEAFGAKEMYITCEGETIETGHICYDFPITFIENY